MPEINLGEHASIFGVSGSGKSTLTRSLAENFSRRIIFDRMGEWPTEFYCFDFDSFVHLYRQHVNENSFQIIFRPKPGLDRDNLLEVVDQILALVYRVESQKKVGIGIIIEEAWLYAPVHSMPPWMCEIVLTGRHYKISLVSNAQRPAIVNKILVSQARHVFIGEFFESRDHEYYRQVLGNFTLPSGPPQKFQFYWYRPNCEISTLTVNPI